MKISPAYLETAEFLVEITNNRSNEKDYVWIGTLHDSNKGVAEYVLHQKITGDFSEETLKPLMHKSVAGGKGFFINTVTTDKTRNRTDENCIDPLAIIADYDGGVEAPTDDRLIDLGLPLPTLRVESGGGWHLWWFLDENGCSKIQRNEIVKSIAIVTGGDLQMKSGARLLRLPGSIHLKDPENPKLVSITEKNYDRRYTFTDFEQFLTIQKSVPVLVKSPHESYKQTKLTDGTITSYTIPIERLLSREHRSIMSGVGKGGRNSVGTSLSRDLIGVEALGSIEVDYCGKNYLLEIDGDAESLFFEFASGCHPPLSQKESQTIWNSAVKSADGNASTPLGGLEMACRKYLKDILPKRGRPRKDNIQVIQGLSGKEYHEIGMRFGIDIPPQGMDTHGVPNSKLLKLKLDLFDLLGDRLKFNEMSREIELDGSTIDLNLAKDFISSNLHYDSSTENCMIALTVISTKHQYHPVRVYLESLRGKDINLDLITNFPEKYFGNSDRLQNQLFFRKLVASVARVMAPGAKDDSLLVLQGKQGAGKSTALAALAGDDWFNDDLRSLDDKDEIAKLSRFWILELAEVDYLFGKKEVELFKRFLSCKEDTFRPPYGRSNILVKRTCGLFATTNKSEFLTDPTGDRRYWVVECNSDIDIEGIRRDRDLIWATSLAAYENGHQWHLTDEEKSQHSSANEVWRDNSDPWSDLILNNLFQLLRQQGSTEYVCIQEIMDQILKIPLERQDKKQRNRIGNVLQMAGFERKCLKIDKKNTKVWGREIGTGQEPSDPLHNYLRIDLAAEGGEAEALSQVVLLPKSPVSKKMSSG
jgi:predicted P-loop ATPase